MPTIRNKATGLRIGNITDADVKFLIDQLEEESHDDRDYYIDAATVDMLEDEGGSPALIAALRAAVEGRDGVDVEID
jgi:processive 1,2-diacylglycerol beta-glucosyltransferase